MKKSSKKPKVNKELEGFELKVNSFGELKSNIEIDKINEFLDKNVTDKKLGKGKKKTKGRNKK